MNDISDLTKVEVKKLPKKYAEAVSKEEKPKELVWFLNYKDKAAEILGEEITSKQLGDLETSPIVYSALQLAFLKDKVEQTERPRKKVLRIKAKIIRKRLNKLLKKHN